MKRLDFGLCSVEATQDNNRRLYLSFANAPDDLIPFEVFEG